MIYHKTTLTKHIYSGHKSPSYWVLELTFQLFPNGKNKWQNQQRAAGRLKKLHCVLWALTENTDLMMTVIRDRNFVKLETLT